MGGVVCFKDKISSLRNTTLKWRSRGSGERQGEYEVAPHWDCRVDSVRMLGVSGKLKYTRDANGLTVTLPDKRPCDIALALKITKG